MSGHYYRPPGTEAEWDAAWVRIRERRSYWQRVMNFADHNMVYMRWYTIARFVKPENRGLFKDCISFLIAWFHCPIEFDSRFERIRRYEDYPREDLFPEKRKGR